LGKSAKDDAIKRIFFDIIRDDFDNTPEAAAMHMQLLLKWLQMDTKVKASVLDFIADYNKSQPAGPQQISEKIFSELIRDKFVRAYREEGFYSPHLALTSLQKQALLEKLRNDLLFNGGDSLSSKIKEAKQWREGQKEIVSELAAKRGEMQPVSVATRNSASEANVSDGERSAFSVLRMHFAQLDPGLTKDASLLDGEEQCSSFTFLGTEQGGGNEGAILKGEFDRYDLEIGKGREKAFEEIGFIPENAKLADREYADSVQKALEECDSELKQNNRMHIKNSKAFTKEFFQLTYQVEKFRGIA
jgi:hypothetical protein